MNPYLRSQHLTRLIAALRAVAPGTVFERFGGHLLDSLIDKPLTHRGLNVIGNPVGGNVDTRDEEGGIAAEYSIEQKYFSGAMQKAKADVLHILRSHPNATDLYLLSSQEASTGMIDAFRSDVSDWPGNYGRTFHIYDSRRIAELIVDNLLMNDTAIDNLKVCLPVLAQIRDEHAASGMAPQPIKRHIDRTEIMEQIEARLTASPCLVIWGLGGSGKSEAVAAFGAKHKEDYHVVIWLDGTDVTSIEHLSAIPLVRGGDARNVASLLREKHTLLVIDDVQNAMNHDRLAALCETGSHVVLTQRSRVATGYAMPLMTEAEARLTLNQDIETTCPEEIFSVIWGAVGGHALTLGLMNAAVSDGASWEDIRDDCAAIAEMADGNQRIAERLLERLRESTVQELSFFSWLGSPVSDRGFLRAAINPLGLRKLEQHGLLAVDRPSLVRLHDIVFASLQAGKWLSDERRRELDAALELYISNAAFEMGLALNSVAIAFKEKLQGLITEGKSRPAFLYALMTAWSSEEVLINLIGDPIQAAKLLAEKVGSEVRIDITTVIEMIECIYRGEKVRDIEKAKASLSHHLHIYDHLLAMAGLNERQKSELKHHQAKALNILGNTEAATKIFEEVVTGKCPLDESRLQLIRIYARDRERRAEAVVLVDKILTAATNADAVSNSVTLATIEALPLTGDAIDDMMHKHAEVISNAIINAIQAGVAHGYRALTIAGRHWVWHEPEHLQKIWASIPVLVPAEQLQDDDKFSYAELLHLAAKSSPDRAAEFQTRSLKFIESMQNKDAFKLQKYGEILHEAGQHGRAIEVLEGLGQAPWALYWLSKAQLAVSNTTGAFDSINMAIDKLPADKAQRFISTFLAQRFEVRYKQCDQECIKDLQQAISECQGDKYRMELIARLKAFEARKSEQP